MTVQKTRKRVAVFPAGSEIGLEIHEALKYSTFFDVVGFSSVPCHASFVFKEYHEGLPFYTHPDFMKQLNRWIEEYRIDFLYPAYDDIQLFLTLHQDELACRLVTSDENTVHICRSKKRTYKFFQSYSFIPEFYENPDEIPHFPVFAKPDIGQGSQGACMIHSQTELLHALEGSQELVVCEYLPGEEFTVDCFTDYAGTLLSCNMRNRKRIRNGISVASSLVTMDPMVQRMAQLINERLHFTGAWFFQVKKNQDGAYRLLEIAPRIAGTMGLTRNLGINYPLLTLFTAMNMPVAVNPNTYDICVDRALISRYHVNIDYHTVYVDLDDTLLVRDRVNTALIAFLYQCVNKGKQIILLTKHIHDIHSTLAQHRISEKLFDSIVGIAVDDEKSNYVKGNSIFIDDSFSERNKIKEACRIPVFDCSEVEALLDWRDE